MNQLLSLQFNFYRNKVIFDQGGPLPLGQNHESDEHYHGEPSRVLDNQTYPETAVLYPGTAQTTFFTNESPLRESDVDYWMDEFQSVSSIEQVLTHDIDNNPANDTISLSSELNFSGQSPEIFSTESLLSKNSVLFVPGRLRLEEGYWDDLDSNDVSVNWISLDPDEKGASTARAIVLSDWIVTLKSNLPKSRSSGRTPGIFHLVEETLENFTIELSETGNLFQSLNNLLDDPEEKFRPGFIRDRVWHFD